MIHDASTLHLPARIKTELCIVGSGAGGSMAAMVAAEAGMDVLVLEAGEFLTPDMMSQREEEMLPKLFWEAGIRTSKDKAIKILQGKGVGGSTLHNINLCKRIPDILLLEWMTQHNLASLDLDTWHALYDEVESLLQVSAIPRALWTRHNLLLEQACKNLGWKGAGLSHNRTGCMQSGFCMLGCAYDAKNNAAKVLMPKAVAASAQVLTHCQAIRIIKTKGRATGIEAVALDPATSQPMGLVVIEAAHVCLSAAATGTAALLKRSNIPAPEGSTGQSLRIHPAVVVAGDFEEPVYAWRGIPQSYECTEFLDFEKPDGHRSWILPVFAHPMGTSVMLPGHGAFHREIMERYAHLGIFTAVLHDTTKGSVTPSGDLGLSIDYQPNPQDKAELALGLQSCARLLFAAGARRVLLPGNPPVWIENEAHIPSIERLIENRTDLAAVHPMGSAPMGDDPRTHAVSSQGKHHHMDGLWIADGSLFPTSIGVPPQLSIYAMGLHVGRALVQSTGRQP